MYKKVTLIYFYTRNSNLISFNSIYVSYYYRYFKNKKGLEMNRLKIILLAGLATVFFTACGGRNGMSSSKDGAHQDYLSLKETEVKEKQNREKWGNDNDPRVIAEKIKQQAIMSNALESANYSLVHQKELKDKSDAIWEEHANKLLNR